MRRSCASRATPRFRSGGKSYSRARCAILHANFRRQIQAQLVLAIDVCTGYPVGWHLVIGSPRELDLAAGQTFKREDIAPLFGETFNSGSWNAGHVTLASKNAIVLLVTLNNQGKVADHRFLDHWIDDSTSHWQSQNSTSPTNKKGRDINEHEQKGLTIHLFVRESKLDNGKGAPFIYRGPVRYVSHEGSSPMNVVFSLVTP